MYNNKWIKLKRTNYYYILEPDSASSGGQCLTRINFAQLAFDEDSEHLVTVDSCGNVYCIELSEGELYYKKLGFVGQATFVAFNPAEKYEILIGLSTADIKIIKIDKDINSFCLLSGHKIPTTCISFYKDYCLTCSHKEVIIWFLRSCSKAHQLRINTNNVIVKKASFSNLGHIVVLYNNDTVQSWQFKQLETDVKIDLKIHGIRNVRDFVFTRNGRAMILGSRQNKIIILNTCNWNLLKSLALPETFIGIRQLCIVPMPLDGGANKMLAVVSSNCTLHFFDINVSCFSEISQTLNKIKKLAISFNGRYISYIEKEGCLKIIFADTLTAKKSPHFEKIKDTCRPRAHKVKDHLQCVRQNMRQELKLDRLLPILKEFGKYPDMYRTLIWSTILKLPSNKNAYITLAEKVINDNFMVNIFKDYPLADRNKVSLLNMTISYLAEWCPLLVQSSFLPNLVFPFLMVFQKDPLLAFELILTILLNYCQKWFEYHPLPPLNTLGIIENILLEIDPQLLKTFCEHGVTSSEYAWPLLKTAMSEVLTGDEWLILWDHLLSYQKPSLLLMCVIAYSICSRYIIFSLHTSEEIQQFYNNQGHLKAKDLLKVAQKLDHEVPERLHPKRYLRNTFIELSSEGPYPPFMLHEYPKFLTENIDMYTLKHLKEREKVLQERGHTAVKLAEEKRLNQEVEAFRRQIHEERLNEVQKCFQNHMQLSSVIQNHLEYGFKYKESVVPPLNLGEESATSENTENMTSISENQKVIDYERMQEDVEKLENEVKSLLSTLRSRKSEVDIT